VAKADRGFASMDRSKQREIASKGGRVAHQKGAAHEWTSEEARAAGRKGGVASHRFGPVSGTVKATPNNADSTHAVEPRPAPLQPTPSPDARD
jgi:general stress protein YciG